MAVDIEETQSLPLLEYDAVSRRSTLFFCFSNVRLKCGVDVVDVVVDDDVRGSAFLLPLRLSQASPVLALLPLLT